MEFIAQLLYWIALDCSGVPTEVAGEDDSANDSLWEYKEPSPHSQCCRLRVGQTGSQGAARQHKTNNHCKHKEHSLK